MFGIYLEGLNSRLPNQYLYQLFKIFHSRALTELDTELPAHRMSFRLIFFLFGDLTKKFIRSDALLQGSTITPLISPCFIFIPIFLLLVKSPFLPSPSTCLMFD